MLIPKRLDIFSCGNELQFVIAGSLEEHVNNNDVEYMSI